QKQHQQRNNPAETTASRLHRRRTLRQTIFGGRGFHRQYGIFVPPIGCLMKVLRWNGGGIFSVLSPSPIFRRFLAQIRFLDNRRRASLRLGKYRIGHLPTPRGGTLCLYRNVRVVYRRSIEFGQQALKLIFGLLRRFRGSIFRLDLRNGFLELSFLVRDELR